MMNAANPYYSTSPLLDQVDSVVHGFFGSQGGVSGGLYQSLNCGHSSLDETNAVETNRARVARQFSLNAQQLFSLRQVHSNTVVHIKGNSSTQFETQADGMVCDEPDLALGVLGADCAPVLFVDPVRNIIGAAHSGWKGALDGINEAVLDKMRALGSDPSNIIAAIGPCMQQAAYEVKEDFRRQFMDESPIGSQAFFQHARAQSSGSQHTRDALFFDTAGYIQARLEAYGINQIDVSKEDTFSQKNKYFSYRRACQLGHQDYGRQVSIIALKL